MGFGSVLLQFLDIAYLLLSTISNCVELCRASINLLTQIAYSVNKNIKMSSFKSNESIQKKEGGPDRSVSDKQSSSVTLNDLAMKARKKTVISSFSKEVIH